MAQQAIDQEKHALGAGAQAQREAANQPRAEGEQILPPGEAAPLLFKPPDNTNQDRPSFTRAATSDERSVWSEPSDAPDERVDVGRGQLANLPMADQEKTNLLAFAVGLGLALLLSLGAYLLADWAATSGDDAALEIVASAMLTGSNDQDDLWQVQGTILESGQLVALKDVRLVVVLQDVRGNEYFGTDLSPDGAGQGQAAPHVFKFEVKQPRLLAGPDERRVDLITVRAYRTKNANLVDAGHPVRMSGERQLRPHQGTGFSVFRQAVRPFILSLGLFVATLFLVVLGNRTPFIMMTKYYATVLLTLGFAAAMIAGIALTMHKVAACQRNDVASVGFAYVFFGRYSDAAEPEWILSLTTPRLLLNEAEASRVARVNTDAPEQLPEASRLVVLQAASPETPAQVASTSLPSLPDERQNRESSATAHSAKDPAGSAEAATAAESASPITSPIVTAALLPSPVADVRDRGFGAPLWVLLLSVVGAAVYTVKLIVDALSKDLCVEVTKEGNVSAMLKDVVQHQVFTLFAPLTAMFVYQGMVATNTNHDRLPVAVAALASGLTLNALLVRALRSSVNRVQAHKGDGPDAAGTSA